MVRPVLSSPIGIMAIRNLTSAACKIQTVGNPVMGEASYIASSSVLTSIDRTRLRKALCRNYAGRGRPRAA